MQDVSPEERARRRAEFMKLSPERYEEVSATLSDDAEAKLEKICRLIMLYHLDRAWADHLAFLADIRAKAAVDHPHVGTVYEAVIERDLCFYAHELLPGATFEDRRLAGVLPGFERLGAVAINLLVALTQLGLSCRYVSQNATPRAVYKAKLTGTMSGSRADAMFMGSGAFVDANDAEYDVLIVSGEHFGMGKYMRIGFGPPAPLVQGALDRVSQAINRFR